MISCKLPIDDSGEARSRWPGHHAQWLGEFPPGELAGVERQVGRDMMWPSVEGIATDALPHRQQIAVDAVRTVCVRHQHDLAEHRLQDGACRSHRARVCLGEQDPEHLVRSGGDPGQHSVEVLAVPQNLMSCCPVLDLISGAQRFPLPVEIGDDLVPAAGPSTP